jgi:hypothetical protein
MMYLWEVELKLHKVVAREGLVRKYAREVGRTFVGGVDALAVLREVEATYLAEKEYDEENGADVTTERVEVASLLRGPQVHHILMCAEGEPK